MKEINEYSLIDGQVIEDELYSQMSIGKFIVENKNNYFSMGLRLKSNFVGFIELTNDYGELIRIWSYPKEYFSITNARQATIQDKKMILKSIKIASKYSEKIIGNGNGCFSNVNAIIDIVGYYNHYGIYKEIDKVHQKKNKGRVNWSKTIKTKKPIISNSNLIYNDFIVKKKSMKNTIVSQAMAYILIEVAPSYDFLFTVPICKETYDKYLFSNYKHVASLLEVEKDKTFKDIDKKLIHALITYFTSASGNILSVNLATSNFNLVWEAMVNQVLNTRKEKIVVGKNKIGENFVVEPDHVDREKFMIADSKYYTYQEHDDLDYKQLFYFYHIITSEAIRNGNDKNVIELHKKWNNYLIKPRNIETLSSEKPYIIEPHLLREKNGVDDFVNIKNVYIHPKKLIQLYTEN